MAQPGFFDLNELIEWEDFRTTLEIIRVKKRKNKAGRKPFDGVPFHTSTQEKVARYAQTMIT